MVEGALRADVVSSGKFRVAIWVLEATLMQLGDVGD